MYDILDNFVVTTLLVGVLIIFGLMVIASFQGISKEFKFKGIPLCFLGIHKRSSRENGIKKLKYYCVHCKKGRKHPKLVGLDGGRANLR